MKTPPLDQFTFGKTKAAIALAERLSILENDNIIGYASTLLCQSNSTVKEIDKIENSRVKAYLLELHAKNVANKISNNYNIPEYIKTYLNNVAQSKIKSTISGK